MDLLTLATILLGGYLALVVFIERRKKYWARKGVPYLELEIPFVSASSKDPRAGFVSLQDQYKLHKKLGHRHLGIFNSLRPVYMPIDPDLVRNILAKDFAHFMDRGIYYTEKWDPMSAQLTHLEGQKWKDLRTKLTPTFTSGKMKMMFQTLVDCGVPMVDRLRKKCEGNEAVDIKEVLACFTTDVIGSCAFGLDCNSFKSETEDSPFRAAGKNFFGMNRSRMMRMTLIAYFPEICKTLGVPMFEKSLTNFFLNVVKDIVKYREENSIVRNDFMQLLLELRKTKDEKTGKPGFTVEDIASQAFLFFKAGFETSSTLMHFCCYELAENPEVQEKVREEVVGILGNDDGELTYEKTMGMKYLGQALEETLRKYPPVPTLLRKCVIDYKIPDSDITIEAGTRVDIPVYCLHRDPEFYPDPEKFDPERFSEKNKASRHPYVYIPFGEGPRICIGLRFGLMQARVGMALILKNFKIKLHPKTITPIGVSPTAFLMASKNKIWLELEEL